MYGKFGEWTSRSCKSPTKMSEAAGAQNYLQKPSKVEPQIEVVRANSAELYG